MPVWVERPPSIIPRVPANIEMVEEIHTRKPQVWNSNYHNRQKKSYPGQKFQNQKLGRTDRDCEDLGLTKNMMGHAIKERPEKVKQVWVKKGKLTENTR